MAFIIRGSAGSTATNPVLDLFTSVSGILTDAYEVGFRVFDVSSDENMQKYISGQEDDVQVFPLTPGTFFTLDVEHLTSDPVTPGHKLSTGHYYAPFECGDCDNTGNYIIKWRFKWQDADPYEYYCEEFVVISEGAIVTGLTKIEKLKLFMQDIISKNELIDEMEYTDQQYALAFEFAAMRYNAINPLTCYNTENFPRCAEYFLYLGAAGHLMLSTSIEQLRNQLSYTDGNIHVGLKDKHAAYIQAGNLLLTDFDNKARGIKNQLNNDSAWGESASPLLSGGTYGYWWGGH